VSTHRQIYYHIVFATKGRQRVLPGHLREELLRYMWGILRNKGCHLYRINAVEDHVHLLMDLPPSLALAEVIRALKVASTLWLRGEERCPGFVGWQEGYGAFTVCHAHRGAIVEYIRAQEEHHRTVSFAEELRALLREAGLDPDAAAWDDPA